MCATEIKKTHTGKGKERSERRSCQESLWILWDCYQKKKWWCLINNCGVISIRKRLGGADGLVVLQRNRSLESADKQYKKTWSRPIRRRPNLDEKKKKQLKNPSSNHHIAVIVESITYEIGISWRHTRCLWLGLKMLKHLKPYLVCPSHYDLKRPETCVEPHRPQLLFI